MVAKNNIVRVIRKNNTILAYVTFKDYYYYIHYFIMDALTFMFLHRNLCRFDFLGFSLNFYNRVYRLN